MHEDGSVGRLDKKDIEVTFRAPGRVEGKERIVTQTTKRLAEVALYADFAECLAEQKSNTRPFMPINFRNTEWSIEDMPDETLIEFKEWCNRPPIDIESVRNAANEQAVSWHEREGTTVACEACNGSNYTYACRICGYSRQFYKYPVVRYQQKDSTYDVPMDAAAFIQLNPQSLSLKTRSYFNDRGMMMAERVLQFDATELPDGYIPDVVPTGVVSVNAAEELARPLEIVVERWTELEGRSRLHENAQARIHGPDEFAARQGYFDSPDACLRALQRHITQRLYHEGSDTEQSALKLKELQRKVGEYGFKLAYEYSYAGMGESDAKFMLARRKDDYVNVQPITYDIDVQHGIETALRYVDAKN